jgi:tRNA(fMet)-specific endonuclease VapC
MKYLLDTNAWIHFLNNPGGLVGQRIKSQLPADICLCSVVVGELRTGAYKSARLAANLSLIALLQQQFVSIPFDDRAADRYAQIRANLEAQGQPIGPYDTQIAAIALIHGLIVVTHNTAEFSRVTGLTLEDWSIP